MAGGHGGSGSRNQARLKRGSQFIQKSQPLSLPGCFSEPAGTELPPGAHLTCLLPAALPSSSPLEVVTDPRHLQTEHLLYLQTPTSPQLLGSSCYLLLPPDICHPSQHPSPPPILFHFYFCAWRALSLSTVYHWSALLQPCTWQGFFLTGSRRAGSFSASRLVVLNL